MQQIGSVRIRQVALCCITGFLGVLQVLILGRNMSSDDADLLPYVESGHITVQPPGRPWRDFLKLLQTARSLFVPNVHDASPR